MDEEVSVELNCAIYSLDVLNAAAYRLIDTAGCVIEKRGDSYICRLKPKGASASEPELRSRFIDLVTDENLRASLAARTEPVRNLILSLAFGALAAEPTEKR